MSNKLQWSQSDKSLALCIMTAAIASMLKIFIQYKLDVPSPIGLAIYVIIFAAIFLPAHHILVRRLF